MSNPFDFDDAEAAKQFEKNTIFGIDPEMDHNVDFMKVSLAAANMNTGLEDYDGRTVNVPSFKQPHLGGDKTAASSNMRNIFDGKSSSKRNSSGAGVSVRGHVNTTTSITKPHFEGRKKDINLNITLEKENDTINDVIQKAPQISAEDYKRLQDELARAKKMIETLKYEKWSSIPVNETVKRIVTGKPYTLDGYKSMADKKGLLNNAVKCGDGNAIITVVIFLERTLSAHIFQKELLNCPKASHHYIQHLRRNEDWRKLEQFYKDQFLIEDAALLRYEQANQIKDIKERIVELHKWLNEYGERKVVEVEELKSYISDEIKLLEKQRQIEEEDKTKEATDPVMRHFPRFSIELKPLIKTVEYCALYHYNKGHQFHPEGFKKVYQLTDKQYEWVVISPLAYVQRWPEIDELLTSTKWFGKKTAFSHIGFENVFRILHQSKADDQKLENYAKLISNLEMRIKYAEKVLLHDVVIDAIFQLKDRHRMEEYRTMIGDTSRIHQLKINDLLHNSSIKWR